jgi:hypothetical protein
MHDANGKVLAKGDVVFIPAVITDLYAGEDFCNATLQTVYGRRPDGAHEAIAAINTGVLMRARPSDTFGYGPVDEARAALSPG